VLNENPMFPQAKHHLEQALWLEHKSSETNQNIKPSE
jgi:hypothetical protein